MTVDQWIAAKKNLAQHEERLRYRLLAIKVGALPESLDATKAELAEVQATRERLRRSIGRRGHFLAFGKTDSE